MKFFKRRAARNAEAEKQSARAEDRYISFYNYI